VDPDAVAHMPVMPPSVVIIITLAAIIMAFNVAHFGAAVRTAHAVEGTVEAGSAPFTRLRGRRSSGRYNRGGAKSNQSFHLTSPLLSRGPTRRRKMLFHELPFTNA